MNYRFTTILLAVALLLILGVNMTQAAPLDRTDTSKSLVAPAGNYDFGAHGTAWVAQKNTQFKLFRPYGWGIVTKAKAAGKKWVHISVPFPTRIAEDRMLISYVEFCAQSSNGAITKPIRWDMWDNNGMFYSEDISWPGNNNKNCYGHTFNPPFAIEGLGVSVQLNFANTTDKITLYKAWVRVTPP